MTLLACFRFLPYSQVGKRSLEFFNDYFGKRYPLPKLDLVALSRLSVGAMENWGVITFRQEERSEIRSIDSLKRNADVIL